MREHDAHIRLYTPILQRIIVLVAVIVAVPVVLWTITAFVRTYIGPPQIPTFRPIAAVQSPPAPNVQVAVQTANPAIATDARSPLLEIKKPSDPPAAAAADLPAAAPALASAPPAAPPPPVPAQIAAVPPPPFAAANPNTGASTSTMPATVAAPPNVTPAPASTMAWPSPTAFDPSPRPADTVASAEQATVVDANDLPRGVPLKGRIPLPPHRPNMTAKTAPMTNVALVNSAASATALPAASPVPARGAVASSVPLPRARPAAAPEPAPVEAPPVYDPAALH